jgi:hypothetical protein
MNKLFQIIGLILSLCFFTSNLFAQNAQGFWSVRGGYLRSFPTASEPTIPSPNVYKYLGISPINSFYLGVSYTKLWTKIGYTIDVNLQRKGMEGIDVSQQANTVPINDYYYINISPLAYYNLNKNISIQIGPELNTLVSKNSVFSHSRAVEFGGNIRLGYTINRLIFQVGASHGFTPYSVSKFVNQDVFYLRNTSLQIGLAYKVRHL